MGKIKAIKHENGLCYKCLNIFDESIIHNINIFETDYGSNFDESSMRIQLCNSCYHESLNKISDLWCMEEYTGKYDFKKYKYDDEMYDYILNLPVQSRQLILNEFYNNTYINMTAQDWIDYELKILPHKKCKEYGLYSFDEIKSYKERFTTCEYPVNKIYNDGSKGCGCPFKANGEYNQKIYERNISDECYSCNHYKKREIPIKDVAEKDFYDYMEYLRMKIRFNELEEKFSNF